MSTFRPAGGESTHFLRLSLEDWAPQGFYIFIDTNPQIDAMFSGILTVGCQNQRVSRIEPERERETMFWTRRVLGST